MFLAPAVPPLLACAVTIADGAAGTWQTIEAMRALVRQGRIDPLVRATAVNLTALLPERDWLHEIQTLFEFVRDRIRYVSDILDVETLHGARQILQMQAGDCDDKSILLASLLESIGHKTRFIVTGYHVPEMFEHVYVGVETPIGLISLDASEPRPMGWEPPNAIVRVVEKD